VRRKEVRLRSVSLLENCLIEDVRVVRMKEGSVLWVSGPASGDNSRVVLKSL